MRWAGHVARVGDMRNAYNILVGNPDGNRPLGRLGRRRAYNIRIDLMEILWKQEWLHVAQYRDQWRVLVNTVMNLRGT
jgi:hypothetical protein